MDAPLGTLVGAMRATTRAAPTRLVLMSA